MNKGNVCVKFVTKYHLDKSVFMGTSEISGQLRFLYICIENAWYILESLHDCYRLRKFGCTQNNSMLIIEYVHCTNVHLGANNKRSYDVSHYLFLLKVEFILRWVFDRISTKFGLDWVSSVSCRVLKDVTCSANIMYISVYFTFL